MTSVTGWTPFFVALHRRHWETARLVVAIATAQYQTSDAETAPLDPTIDVLSDGKKHPRAPYYHIFIRLSPHDTLCR